MDRFMPGLRRAHRWVSAVFMLAVGANLVALALDNRAVWIGLLALFPLIALMISGTVMWVGPVVAKRRTGRAELKEA